jgi:hypothetical protein
MHRNQIPRGRFKGTAAGEHKKAQLPKKTNIPNKQIPSFNLGFFNILGQVYMQRNQVKGDKLKEQWQEIGIPPPKKNPPKTLTTFLQEQASSIFGDSLHA